MSVRPLAARTEVPTPQLPQQSRLVVTVQPDQLQQQVEQVELVLQHPVHPEPLLVQVHRPFRWTLPHLALEVQVREQPLEEPVKSLAHDADPLAVRHGPSLPLPPP